MPVSSTGAAASQNSIPQPSKNEKAAFCGVAAAIRQAIEGEEKGEWDLPDADASDEEMNDWIHKYHANTLPTEAVKAHIVVDEGLELVRQYQTMKTQYNTLTSSLARTRSFGQTQAFPHQSGV